MTIAANACNAHEREYAAIQSEGGALPRELDESRFYNVPFQKDDKLGSLTIQKIVTTPTYSNDISASTAR